MALVAWYDGVAELFGVVSDEERRHWETVRDHGPLHVDAVARRLDIDESVATIHLDQLQSRRLLMRHDYGFAVPGSTPEAA